MFINLPGNVRVEVFYMNQEKCDNYNGYHRLREGFDNPVTPGYYYDDFVGPFTTKNAAISSATLQYA
jgi:hypothetical protein